MAPLIPESTSQMYPLSVGWQPNASLPSGQISVSSLKLWQKAHPSLFSVFCLFF